MKSVKELILLTIKGYLVNSPLFTYFKHSSPFLGSSRLIHLFYNIFFSLKIKNVTNYPNPFTNIFIFLSTYGNKLLQTKWSFHLHCVCVDPFIITRKQIHFQKKLEAIRLILLGLHDDISHKFLHLQLSIKKSHQTTRERENSITCQNSM